MKFKFSVILPVAATDEIPSLSNTGKETLPETLLVRPKIGFTYAEGIALVAVPDTTVKEAELEDEGGGLCWLFDPETFDTKKITEVSVDTAIGKIVANKVENEKEDARPGHEHKAN